MRIFRAKFHETTREIMTVSCTLQLITNQQWFYVKDGRWRIWYQRESSKVVNRKWIWQETSAHNGYGWFSRVRISHSSWITFINCSENMLYFTLFDIVQSASCQFREVNWVSTVIWEWKVLVTSRWLVTEFDATLTNQMQSLNRSNLGHPHFPALHEVCLFLLWVLIGF